MNNNFQIGDEFIGTYPPECAEYLNETQIGHIEEIEPGLFRIVENVYEESISDSDNSKQLDQEVEELKQTVDDLVLMMAEMIGGGM